MPSNSSKQSEKRKNVSLSIKEKVELLKKLEAGSKVFEICDQYGIGKSTVYDIKHQKEKILEYFSEYENNISNRKYVRHAKNVSVDLVMYDWVRERHSEGQLLTGPLLMAQAKVFHDVMEIKNDCVYSIGWLNRFKNRYGIRLGMSGEVEFIHNSNQKDETQTQTEDSESSPKRREQPKRSTRSNLSAIYNYNFSDEETENTSNLQAPSSSTSKLKSALLSGTQCASLDLVQPTSNSRSVAGTRENETCTTSADATVLDSPIVIKEELIEIEEDQLVSLHPSCSRDSFVQDSERHSPPVSSADSNSDRFQNVKSYPKRVKRPRQNSSVACSSKDDPTENSEVSDSSRAGDSFDAFGVFVASKLRKLDWKSCASVQKAFTDVLFEAELGLFLTPEEKTSFEKKSDSLIVGLQDAVTDISTAELSSQAESADSISSCAEISTS